MHAPDPASRPPRSGGGPGHACHRRARRRCPRSTGPGRRGSEAPPSAPALWLPRGRREAGGWPNMRAANCCPRATAARRQAREKEWRPPSFLQRFHLIANDRDIAFLNRADVLVADGAIRIDDEGLGDAGCPEGDLDLALRIGADVLVGIAVAREELGDVLRAIADRDPGDQNALALELGELLRIGNARHAPAGKEVDHGRSAIAAAQRPRWLSG